MSETRRAARTAARALRRHGEWAVTYHGFRPRYAIVRSVDPLIAEVTDSELVLDEDDLLLSQGVKQLVASDALQVGDTLLVDLMNDDDFIARDVLTDVAPTPPVKLDEAQTWTAPQAYAGGVTV